MLLDYRQGIKKKYDFYAYWQGRFEFFFHPFFRPPPVHKALSIRLLGRFFLVTAPEPTTTQPDTTTVEGKLLTYSKHFLY